jgi:hypothetical protein
MKTYAEMRALATQARRDHLGQIESQLQAAGLSPQQQETFLLATMAGMDIAKHEAESGLDGMDARVFALYQQCQDLDPTFEVKLAPTSLSWRVDRGVSATLPRPLGSNANMTHLVNLLTGAHAALLGFVSESRL